ncbi:hypothetical protein HHK36_018574 [Tetracentron sinense]|uniref:Protein EARLY FLOWERING 4 domain-containing protein n=1 Tax=Tetracentron sinense TaxID=13715 RepID=A0A834YW75_TETSI|nr:hypothetical protein HHK36_018574 [Tetracentron sinense]
MPPQRMNLTAFPSPNSGARSVSMKEHSGAQPAIMKEIMPPKVLQERPRADTEANHNHMSTANNDSSAPVADKSFRQVQSVLDQNRVLIQQVNENHQSKIRDNLTKNVALIREINGNISKVVSLYSSLSSNFSNIFHQRPGILDGTSNDVNSKGGNTEA